jgi:NADPH2:quinone reductase
MCVLAPDNNRRISEAGYIGEAEMRAIGYQNSLSSDEVESLVDIGLPKPVPGPRDLLVAVRAVSVNPVDTKVRMRSEPAAGQWKVLGWDAAGIVEAIGSEVTAFKPGDEVFYAGALQRPGTNSEFHLVDERIVGPKPGSLGFAEAAALPLTAITAWEALFDRLEVERPVDGAAPAILIVGGAGGVGSIATQLLRARTDLTVITTASRPETREWCLALGAHHVLDHGRPLADQMAALGIGEPAFVLSTTQTDRHLREIADLIAPQGRFCLIDDPGTIDISVFKQKSVSIHWEFMFTRSMFDTRDMARQSRILTEVSGLVDTDGLRTTLSDLMQPINAANLRRAHAMIESGRTIGKLVLEGW